MVDCNIKDLYYGRISAKVWIEATMQYLTDISTLPIDIISVSYPREYIIKGLEGDYSLVNIGNTFLDPF